MKPILRLAAAAGLLAACAPAVPPASAPDGGAGAATIAGVMRLEDRREYDARYLEQAAAGGTAVRRRTAMALANLRDPRALPVLGRLLADPDTGVAARAAFALGQIGDTAAVALLVPYLDTQRMARTPTVVGEAAMALGKLRHTESKNALQAFLTWAPRTGPGVREAVGQALLAVWRQPRPLPVEAVARWLDVQDPELRWRAAYALARRAEPAATAALFGNQRDPSSMVRSLVARSLSAAMADSSRIGAEAAQDALIRLARNDSSQIVRINALRSLGSYRTERALALLANVAFTAPPYEAVTAMESLQRMGPFAASAAPMLEGEARDEDLPVFVRQTAVAALQAVDPMAAVRLLPHIESSPRWRLRASAARVYGGDSIARRQLPALLRDPDGRVAAAGLEQALTAVGDSGAAPLRPLLLEALRVPDVIVRTNALGGLARLADPATLPVVLDAYERAQADTLNDAALAAVDAVGAIARADRSAARQFYARFPRSRDYLVRQRAQAALGDTVPGAWGAPLPIETGLAAEDYAQAAADAAARPRPRARIETDRGTIELELFADDAPLTVRSFLSLAESGFFDGQEWPRVVPNFVIQGGDPRGDTSGGPGYTLRDEINRHTYLRGTLGMALSGPDTGGSQWFVTHSPQPHLDGTYTVFGRVVRGMEVADAVLPGDRIIRIREVR